MPQYDRKAASPTPLRRGSVRLGGNEATVDGKRKAIAINKNNKPTPVSS